MAWVNPNHAKMFSSKLPIFQQDVESKPSPTPTKGWDAISPLSNMEPDFAVVLDNVVPRPNWVEIRGGSLVWSQSSAGPVETIFVYRPADDPESMFFSAGGTIYDVSDFGAPIISSTGYLNNRWQYINYTPAGAVTHLIAVNGEDNGQIYNGAWANLSVTGISTADLINVNVHKQRIWFIEKESTAAWYLATGAIAGAATEFDIGSLLTKGGFLVAMGTWTVDGGNGPDDLAVFVSNKGQAVVYKGTDPGNANAWFLVGVFNLPPPLGYRCFKGMGSDLLYISIEGLVPISKALPFDPSGVRSVTLTNRILNAMLIAAQGARLAFGWEVELFPMQSLLVMNVPVVENNTQVQFVMNTLTGAWCRFTGWNANTFGIYNESLFYGDNTGNIYLAYAGGADGLEAIAVDIKTAFNYYDDPGRIKIMQMCRPYIVSDSTIIPTLGIDVDFGDSNFAAPISLALPTGALWDVSLWDVATWSTPLTTTNDWQTVGAIGTALAIRIKVNVLPGNSQGQILVAARFDSAMFDIDVFDGYEAITKSGDGVPVLRFNSFQVIIEHGNAVG